MAVEYRSLAYHEPSITTILVVGAFILSANAINHLLDKLIFCGLVGQVLIGVAFGAPGLQWLSIEIQDVVTALGFIGLILIVFEGGLSTNIKTLRANLLLSSMVAITGIVLPIALSYVLQSMLDITPLQAFVAGAALCSTSLGTSFTVLRTSGLYKSRLGVILAGAAMMDDVVGLVLVQIVSTLGSQPTLDAGTVVRPIGVSIAYTVITPLLCKFFVRPVRLALQTKIGEWQPSRTQAFWVHTAVLVAFLASASYAGTSVLFAAYLAGATITWWDNARPQEDNGAENDPAQSSSGAQNSSERTETDQGRPASHASAPTAPSKDLYPTGLEAFEKFYEPALNRLLRPFFFASIGFSIPIANMFDGELVWKGIIYTVLMMLAKMACGLWLVRFTLNLPGLPTAWLLSRVRLIKRVLKRSPAPAEPQSTSRTPTDGIELRETNDTSSQPGPAPVKQAVPKRLVDKPQSLYPAGILGMAMTSRGEIGFLVSAVAQSSGLYQTADGSSKLFLIVTWAIMLCTIIGPISTGLLVKRVWRLQKLEREQSSGRQDPLGIWGVSS